MPPETTGSHLAVSCVGSVIMKTNCEDFFKVKNAAASEESRRGGQHVFLLTQREEERKKEKEEAVWKTIQS